MQPAPAVADAEASRPRRTSSLTDDHDGTRAHVLLLADDAAPRRRRGTPRTRPPGARAGPRLSRRGRRATSSAAGRRASEGRREAAHDLEGRDRVLLADRHTCGEAGLDEALAGHVLDVELARLPRRGVWRLRAAGGGRLVVHVAAAGTATSSRSGYRSDVSLPAEDAAGVDADRPVDPQPPRAPACGRRRPSRRPR